MRGLVALFRQHRGGDWQGCWAVLSPVAVEEEAGFGAGGMRRVAVPVPPERRATARRPRSAGRCAMGLSDITVDALSICLSVRPSSVVYPLVC